MTPSNIPNIERKELKSREWRWWLFFALFLGITMYLLRSVLIPFFLAGALTYLLGPVVRWLVRKLHLPRWAAILIVYVTLIGILAACVILIGPTLKKEMTNFVNNLPQTVKRLFVEAFGGEQIQLMGKSITADAAAKGLLEELQNALGPVGLLKPAVIGIEIIAGFFLSLALLLFMLIGGAGLRQGILNLFPRNRQAQVLFFAVEINHVLGRYVRALALIVAYAGLTAWIGLGLIIKIPYAAPISVFTGLMELVPIVGPVMSLFLSILAAFVSGGFIKMLEAGGVYGVMRLTTDNFIAPIILGKAVSLNPIVVIFAFLAGGTLFGVLGFLLAIPIAASVRVVIENWSRAPRLRT